MVKRLKHLSVFSCYNKQTFQKHFSFIRRLMPFYTINTHRNVFEIEWVLISVLWTTLFKFVDFVYKNSYGQEHVLDIWQ